MPSREALNLDLDRERRWAEIILASQDMMQALTLLHELWRAVADTPRTMMASGAIVTTYCRPFTKNNRGIILGRRWISEFSVEEKAFHKRILRIRNTDIAHTAYSNDRIHVKVGRIIPAVDGIPRRIEYATQYKFQGLMRGRFKCSWAWSAKFASISGLNASRRVNTFWRRE